MGNNTNGMTTLTRVATPTQEKIQREKNNQKKKTKYKQQKNITTRQKHHCEEKQSSSFVLYNFHYP
jgi:hypothetical protein